MKTKDILTLIISALILCGYFIFLFLLMNKTIPAENRDIMNQASGALLTAFVAVVMFWIGSSKSSQEKTDIISKLPPLQ